eukprot:8635386-Pyramimonas_sp.AAC.1
MHFASGPTVWNYVDTFSLQLVQGTCSRRAFGWASPMEVHPCRPLALRPRPPPFGGPSREKGGRKKDGE